MTISDDEMRATLGTAREYAVVLLYRIPGAADADPEAAQRVLWEHARRNFGLRAEGIIDVVLPIRDESDLVGIGIFNTTVDEAREIMRPDPGVKAGLFRVEVHAGRGFPGDALGAAPLSSVE